MARIDGSANQELAGDDSAALTGRVEFSHERFRAKTFQPTEVTADLSSGLMAKLVIDTDDDGRTETWQVGRLKSAKRSPGRSTARRNGCILLYFCMAGS